MAGSWPPKNFNAFAWMVAENDEPVSVGQLSPIDLHRIEKLLGIQPPPVQNQLNGGMEVTYGTRIRPGDVITSVTRLAEYRERNGRHGLMLFTFSEDTWTNHTGEMVKRTRSNQIRY